jgi:signal transduction histidine kinase
VAGLLRFARREECRLAPVDLGDLVRATVGRFGARLDGARVGLAMEAPAGIVVRADAEKIRQALINLIENALDALSEQPGPRRLAVGVSGAGGRAHVRVTDNGPGVPANALARLFEPFFSLKEGGTGLGLAIVRRTVEAHGGRIATESPDGGGATFDIALPLADGPPDDPAHG